MSVSSRSKRGRSGGRVASVALAVVLTAAVAGSVGVGNGSQVAGAVSARPALSGVEPPAGFGVSTVLPNLKAGVGADATAFAYAPDGRIFIARKGGVLDVWDRGVEHVYVDLRAEVNSYQSRGLIGLALDPNFASNGRVYLLFTQELDPSNPDSPEPAGGELISLTHATGKPDVADPASRITLMSGFNSFATLHSVAGLRFSADGQSLFVGLGDGNGNGVGTGQALSAQDLDQLNGKILRIDPTTGLGVPSNPYYDPSDPGSVRSRVFAWGFRNPFRFTVDPTDGTLYVGDVGWNTWEMFQAFPLTTSNPVVDRNAGWPCYEGGDGIALVQPDYAASPITGPTCHALYTPMQGGTGPGALPPLYGYLHTDPGGQNGTAIVGGPRYLGTSNYPTSYFGKVFIGDFARSRMQTLDLSSGIATDFGTAGTWGDPTDIQIAPDGNVAFLAFGAQELDEITFGANNPPVAQASADQTTTTGPSLTVHFSSAGSVDPDGDPITYAWNFGDGSPMSTAANPTHTYTTGVYDAELTITDNHGESDTAPPVQIDVAILPPVVRVASPAGTFRFQIGTTVPIVVKATDPQDGRLAGPRVSTEVDYLTGGHVFPVTGFTGAKGSFVAADEGFQNAFYRITTTATDSAGLATTVTHDVQPQTITVKITSVPSDVTVSVDGVAQTTPYTFTTIVGSQREAAAPATITTNGKTYTFTSWTVSTASPATGSFLPYTAPSSPLKIVATYTAT